jgi:tetratricopeptide (TPR) repeat protein
MTLRAAICLACVPLGGAFAAPVQAASPGSAVAISAVDLFNQGNAYRQRYLRSRTLDEPGSAPPARPPEVLALESYTAALRLSPEFAEAYVNRAAVHYERGDYAAAIADCDAAIRLDPMLAEAYNNRSLAYYKSNDYARAKADFDHTIRLNQHYGNAMVVRALPDVDPAGRPQADRVNPGAAAGRYLPR